MINNNEHIYKIQEQRQKRGTESVNHHHLSAESVDGRSFEIDHLLHLHGDIEGQQRTIFSNENADFFLHHGGADDHLQYCLQQEEKLREYQVLAG